MPSPNPRVSIIISIYNGAGFLNACLSSIADQTFTDYEVIAIDDASDDATVAVLLAAERRFPPGSFKIIRHAVNQGLTRSLNEGLRASSGTYIARIDADDTWHPEKLQKQMDFISAHPECGVVGSFYINRLGSRSYAVRLPIEDVGIKRSLFRFNPIGHSSVVVRKDLLERVSGYDEKIRFSQDYDLWFRLIPHTTFHNLPEFLCARNAQNGLSDRYRFQQQRVALQILFTYLRHYKKPAEAYTYLLKPAVLMLLPAWIKERIYGFFYQQVP